MVWYSHLLTNFPIFCDPHKGFSVVQEAEADDFLPFSCFFSDPTDVGSLISDASLPFLNREHLKFLDHVLLKPSLENFEHYFVRV